MSAFEEFCGCGEYSCGECFSGDANAVGNAWLAAVTPAEMIAAVDDNAKRIAAYGGEYGVPALPDMDVCECGCGGEAHDLIGELGECLRCDDCRRYRPVTP